MSAWSVILLALGFGLVAVAVGRAAARYLWVRRTYVDLDLIDVVDSTMTPGIWLTAAAGIALMTIGHASLS